MRLSRLFIFIQTFIMPNAHAQENVLYQKPSEEILRLADYERPPLIMMNSQKDWIILAYRPTYESLENLNQEEMRLGGLRINPVTNISTRINYVSGLEVRKISQKKNSQLKGLPKSPKIAHISFSPDERKIAFTNTSPSGVELWVADLSNASARKVSTGYLNANMGFPYTWYKDSENLLVRLIPKDRPNLLSKEKDLPKGPIISIGSGEVSQNRTYQDLLKNPQDAHNFEILVTSELHKISLEGGESLFKSSAMYVGESFSPDGNYLMIETIHRPFSYIVPFNRFPRETRVYGCNGDEIKKVNEVALSEIMPKGFSSVRMGKRNMGWRADKASSLYFVEALDKGDQSYPAEYRDEIFAWDAPFSSPPKSLIKLKNRFSGVTWGDDQNALVYESWFDTRNQKIHLLNPSNSSESILIERNYQDAYSNPGYCYSEKNSYGSYVMSIQGGKTYWIGEGYTKDGQFPFIDELDLKTLRKRRIYTSKLKHEKEDIIDIIDVKGEEILVMRQSKTDYPNFYIKSIKGEKTTPLTDFKNPFEDLNGVFKKIISYKRDDGVELHGTLYLPQGYDFKKKPKLPLLIWAYPTEYKDSATAGQNLSNENEFTYPHYGSFVYWVNKGYAVLDNASFPIVGEGKSEPNDSFIPQLIANAKAAIDALDELGYIDREKVAIGGHSYGAFMTANLLTHSDLFACGIARSGAYNRTLTPFGFQGEQRNYWDAPSVYHEMSPFMNADKMKTPLLLVHGDADNNPGTLSLQTERYFQALKDLGAPVRMVLLPKESHSYVAKENILHLLWEQDQFLEKYLKGTNTAPKNPK